MKRYVQHGLILCALALVFQLQAVPNWSVPADVSAVTQVGPYPQFCCDVDGHPIAVWSQQVDDNENNIFGSIFKDGVWQDPEQISESGFNADKPQLCCDGSGHAIVVWRQQVQVDQNLIYRVYGTRYTPGEIPPVIALTVISENTVTDADNPQVCCDAEGHAIVVWQEYDEFEPSWASILGAGFTPAAPDPVMGPETIVGDAAPVSYLQVCCDAVGHAIVVWKHQTGQGAAIHAVDYSPGQVVSSPDVLSTNISTSPRLCCGPDCPIVVWVQYNPPSKRDEIVGTCYVPGETSQIDNISLSPSNAYNSSPSVCCTADGNAMVAWINYEDNTYTIYGAQYTPGSTTLSWDVIAQISDQDPLRFYHPVICCCENCCYENGAAVLWSLQDTENNLYSIYGIDYAPGIVGTAEQISGWFAWAQQGAPEAQVDCCNCTAFALWSEDMEGVKSSYLELRQSITAIVQSDLDCDTGSVTVTVQTSGDPNTLSFQLDGGDLQYGNPVFENVLPGDHTVTVANIEPPFCPVTQTFTVSAALDMTISATLAPECPGDLGSFVVTVTHGAPDYVITVYDHLGHQVAQETTSGAPVTFNLPPDTYHVVAVDENECSREGYATIPEVPDLTLSAERSCNPQGVIMSATGGTPPYTFYVGATEVASGVLAGQEVLAPEPSGLYAVSVVDSNECSAIGSVTVWPCIVYGGYLRAKTGKPTQRGACQEFHRFPVRCDLINTICWSAVDRASEYKVFDAYNADWNNPTVAALATIQASQPLVYCHHNRLCDQKTTYYIVAYEGGIASDPAIITVP